VRWESYYFLGFGVAKWTQQTCRGMLVQVSNSVEEGVFTVYSDGNDDYLYTLTDFLPRYQIWPVGEDPGKGRVVDKRVRVMIGDADPGQVDTVNVENFNSILRGRLGRLVRKTKTFSKDP